MDATFETFVCHETLWELAGLYATRTGRSEFIWAEQRHFDSACAALERLKCEAGFDLAEWWRAVWLIRDWTLSAPPGKAVRAEGGRS